MAEVTTSPFWLPGATIGAYPDCSYQKKEPRAASITTAAAAASGAVTLTNAGLVAGTRYRAVGLGPDSVVRSASFTAA